MVRQVPAQKNVTFPIVVPEYRIVVAKAVNYAGPTKHLFFGFK